MKSLLFLIAAALLILASRISFDLGQQSAQRQFADFCSSPGVLCTIRVGDLYLSSHGDKIDMLPSVTYEMRLDGVCDPKTQGPRVSQDGSVSACEEQMPEGGEQ